MRNIRVAAVQFEHAPGDKAANLGKIRRFVELAADQGVEIIAFPECCITGYWFLRDLAPLDLAALAGRRPAGVLSELVLDDGRMQRLPDLQRFASEHRLPLVSIADLIEYRRSLGTDAIATPQTSRVPAGMTR